MKKIIILIFMSILSGCANLSQHTGNIDQDIVVKKYESGISESDKQNTAELICAKGDRQVYILGTDRPKLSVQFTDNDRSFFNPYYSTVKLRSGKRSFRLHFSFSETYANFEVKDLEFEPNKRYYAYYSVSNNRLIKVWIEDSKGNIIFGKRPEEGQF